MNTIDGQVIVKHGVLIISFKPDSNLSGRLNIDIDILNVIEKG